MPKKSISSLCYILSIFLLLLFSQLPNSCIQVIGDIDQTSETKLLLLTEVKGCFAMQASEPNLGSFNCYVHIPAIHLNQIPISISIYSDPSDIIENFKISTNYSGENNLLEIQVKNLQTTDIVYIYWTVQLFIEYDNYDDLPDSLPILPVNQLPTEAKHWLANTDYVQCEDNQIKEKASDLIEEETDIFKIVQIIANFTGMGIIYGYSGSQDALSVLQDGIGVCTGKSNLGVALLRSSGIPARVIQTGPSPHYQIEFYANQYGWVKSETSNGITPWPFHKSVVTYLNYPEDESSNNVYNEMQPSDGRVAYWGTPKSGLIWGSIHYRTSTDSIQAITSQEFFDLAINVSKRAWELTIENTGNINGRIEENLFAKFTKYKSNAIDCIFENNIEGYIENLEKANSVFDDRAIRTAVIAGSAVGSVIIISVIATTIIIKKRKKIRSNTSIDS